MFVVTCNIGEFSNVVGVADTLALALNLAWEHLQQSALDMDWDYIAQEVNCNELIEREVCFTYSGYGQQRPGTEQTFYKKWLREDSNGSSSPMEVP